MHWKTKGRVAGTIVLFAAFVSANAPILAGPVVFSEDNVQRVSRAPSAQDAEFAARDQFDGFLTHVLDQRLGQDAAIKVASDDGTFWLTDIKRDGRAFTGQTPTSERISFSVDQVRDWSFIGRNGKLYGSYSTRALLPHLPRAQADQIAAVLSDTATPWSATKIARTENFPLQQRDRTNK